MWSNIGEAAIRHSQQGWLMFHECHYFDFYVIIVPTSFVFHHDGYYYYWDVFRPWPFLLSHAFKFLQLDVFGRDLAHLPG